jgi:hypothetical protein
MGGRHVSLCHCPLLERRRLPSLPRLISKWHPILARRYNCSHLPLTSIHFSIDRLPTPGPLLSPPKPFGQTPLTNSFSRSTAGPSRLVQPPVLRDFELRSSSGGVSLSHLALLYVDGRVWVGSEAKQLNSFPPALLVAYLWQ